MKASSNMDDILLRTCTACLQELSELRRTVVALDSKVCVLDNHVQQLTKADTPDDPSPSAPSALCAEDKSNTSLGELCLIQDEQVREAFVNAMQEGELRLELQDLAWRLSKNCSDEAESLQHLCDSLPRELRCGSVRATVFQARDHFNDTQPVSVTRGPVDEIEALLWEELVARIRDAQSRVSEVGREDVGCVTNGMSDDMPATAIMLAPVFHGYCWPLTEAVLRWSHCERMVPTLDLVNYAVKSLTPSVDIDTLVLLQTAPPDFRLVLGVGDTGKVVLRCCPAGRQEPEVAVDGQGSGAAELKTILDAASHCSAALQLLHSDSLEDCTNACGAGGGALQGIEQSHIFEVLVPLRTKKLALALGIPQQLTQACAGALFAACSNSRSMKETEASLVTKAPAAPTLPPEEDVAKPVGPLENHIDDSGTLMHSGAIQPAEVALDKLPREEALVEIPRNCEGERSWNVLGISQDGASAGTDEGAENEVADDEGSQDDQESKSSQDTAKEAMATESQGKVRSVTHQQLAFIECFKKELFNQRTLLLSQLNNLYKMRSGEDLLYKLSGYEKLRDFLLDIPGLALVGRGNRMQVRLQDPSKLEVAQLSWQQCAEEDPGPQFRMPQTLPDSLLHQLHELFLCSERYEIPLRNFLTVWNMHFPTEQLCYRALGFRDVRGLLSQVPFIEKVGGKSDTKYVLKHVGVGPQLASKALAPADQAIVRRSMDMQSPALQRVPPSSLPSDCRRMMDYSPAGGLIKPDDFGKGGHDCSRPPAAPLMSPSLTGRPRMPPGPPISGSQQHEVCGGTAYPPSRGASTTFPDVNKLLSDWTPRLPTPDIMRGHSQAQPDIMRGHSHTQEAAQSQQLGSAGRMQLSPVGRPAMPAPRKPGLQTSREDFASTMTNMLAATHAAYCPQPATRGMDVEEDFTANVAREERGCMKGGWAERSYFQDATSAMVPETEARGAPPSRASGGPAACGGWDSFGHPSQELPLMPSASTNMSAAPHAVHRQEPGPRGMDVVNDFVANVAPEERGSMTGGWAERNFFQDAPLAVSPEADARSVPPGWASGGPAPCGGWDSFSHPSQELPFVNAATFTGMGSPLASSEGVRGSQPFSISTGLGGCSGGLGDSHVLSGAGNMGNGQEPAIIPGLSNPHDLNSSHGLGSSHGLSSSIDLNKPLDLGNSHGLNSSSALVGDPHGRRGSHDLGGALASSHGFSDSGDTAGNSFGLSSSHAVGSSQGLAPHAHEFGASQHVLSNSDELVTGLDRNPKTVLSSLGGSRSPAASTMCPASEPATIPTYSEDREDEQCDHVEELGMKHNKSEQGEGATKVARAVGTGRRLGRTKKNASFFVSSPGAISSESRDASIQQGKFDMSSVLQTQLNQDTPCLVFDISTGQVQATNAECDDLFEVNSGTDRLVHAEFFSLIHESDRDKLSTYLAYLMVSERNRMDWQEVRIVTRTGLARPVKTEGTRLVGKWWHIHFWVVEDRHTWCV